MGNSELVETATAIFLAVSRKDRGDSNGELEDPSASGDAWRVQRVYVNGPGQLGQIAKVIVYNYAGRTTNTVASEDVYYYHYDVLGNVSVISDPNGDEADQFEQDAFGNLVSGRWSGRVGGITEQITTKQYDADLGLYYFNARWYDPVAGAFASRDKWPSSLNKQKNTYLFALASPVTYIDPTGRECKTFFIWRDELILEGCKKGGKWYYLNADYETESDAKTLFARKGIKDDVWLPACPNCTNDDPWVDPVDFFWDGESSEPVKRGIGRVFRKPWFPKLPGKGTCKSACYEGCSNRVWNTYGTDNRFDYRDDDPPNLGLYYISVCFDECQQGCNQIEDD